MFANGSSALRQIGSSMKSAGSRAVGNAAAARPITASSGIEGMSNRKRKKFINDAVGAAERLSAIDTAAHAARTGHIVDATSRLGQEGHHNINIMTGHGSVTAQSTPRPYSGPGRQAATQDGYYSGHSAHTEIAASAGSTPRNTTTAGPALGAGSGRPILALPAGSATVYDAQAGKRPGTTAPAAPKQPFVASPTGEVKKPGAKDLNLKTPSTEERTFIGTKTGRYNREVGAKSTKKTENPKLQSSYEKTSTPKTPVDRTDAQAVDRRLTSMEEDYLNKKKASKKKKAD